MVKKLGLISLIFSSSSNKQLDSATSSTIAAGAPSSSSSSSSMSWQWPSSCKQQPRTLSFRQEQEEQQKAAYKTMNSAYLPADSAADSCFSTSFASVDDDSLSTASDEAGDAVIQALRTGRLFFEPCTSSPATSFILSKVACRLKVKAMSDADTTCSGAIIGDDDNKTAVAFEGATAMTMKSSNPYGDFRASMEEMVLSRSHSRSRHGRTIKDDWRWMEEMLGWYLRANGKSTHGLIVGAFVDLLVALSDDAPPPPSSSPTTTATNRSLSGSSDEIKEEEVAYTCN